MGRGARRALTAVALATAVRAAAAQNPAPAAAPRDTLTPQLLFNDVFEPGGAIPARVELAKDVVYRVEVNPGSATVTIRNLRSAALPPLLMIPLVSAGAASGAAAYLVVPRADGEYRLDVVTGGEPVRLQIWTDPGEMARYTRIRAEGFRAPALAVSLRPEVILPFRDANGSPLDSVLGYHTAAQGAYGAEACLAVVPNGRVLPDRLGGCALTFGLWYRGFGRNFYTIGIAPEVVVARRGLAEFTLSPQLAFGATRGGRPSAQYVFVGVGGRYGAALAGNPKIGFDLTATLFNVRSQPGSIDSRRVSTLTLALGAGIRFLP